MNAHEPLPALHGPQIELNSGAYLNYLEPDPDLMDIEVIAGPLSRLCRFSGQTNKFYSVAQHSVLVANMLPHEFKLAGLMHDATEAFVADMPKPLKGLLLGYNEVEERIWKALCKRYDLPLELPDIVHIADKIAVITEARELLNTNGWKNWYDGIEPLDIPIVPLLPHDAEHLFLQQYTALTGANYV